MTRYRSTHAERLHNLIRTAARLLLPDVIRRPIADRVYRLLAWCRHISCRLGLGTRADSTSDKGAPGRDAESCWMRVRAIPRRIFSRSASALRGTIRLGLTVLWHRAAAYRYLLSANPRQLSLFMKVQKIALAVLFSLPDWYYRYKFTCFDQALKAGSAPDLGRQQCQGATLIIGTLGPGGAERQIMLTVTGLARRAVPSLQLRCQSLAIDWQRFFQKDIESAGVPVDEMGWVDQGLSSESLRSSIIIGTLPASLADVSRFLDTLVVCSPSVAHLWLDECNIKGGLAGLVAGVPKIVLGLRSLPPCNFAIHQPYMREGYRFLARQPNVIMVNNSISGARAYEKWLGLKPGSVRVIHNGFDFDPVVLSGYLNKRDDYRAGLGIKNNVPVVGTVIRFSEEKRPLLWLEIAALVRQRMPEVRFMMVGDGVMREAVEKRAAQEDLVGTVSLLGHQREPLAAMAAMDLFLLTSRLEGLPNVLVEAQALGVPVVTTDVGGAAETVSHGVTGWVSESDNAQHIADLIIRLLKDQVWRSNALRATTTFVQNNFGLARMLDETLDIYGIDSEGMIVSETNEKAI